jgi:hypothetical protein
MNRRISRHIAQYKYILLFTSAVFLLGIIVALGCVNHFDFKRSVISAELRELLILAKSTSRDIENRIFGIKQEPEQIAKLVQHINDEEMLYSFIMNKNHIMLTHPNKGYIGKDIFDVSKGILNDQELSELRQFVQRMETRDSGTAVLYFPSNEDESKKTVTLFSYSVMHSQDIIYYLVIAERLDALTKPMHKNVRDTFVLMGLFFLVFLTVTYVYYRLQKKRIEMEITTRSLEIINKQLHCEIDDYKCIEKRLKNYKS